MIPTSDATAGPAIVDLAYLESSSFGQGEFVLQAIDLLLDQLPIHVRELHEAFHACDWVLLKLTAHKIKSAAALLGMEPVKQTLMALEASPCTQEEMRPIERAVEEISMACTLALEDLRAERYRYL